MGKSSSDDVWLLEVYFGYRVCVSTVQCWCSCTSPCCRDVLQRKLASRPDLVKDGIEGLKNLRSLYLEISLRHGVTPRPKGLGVFELGESRIRNAL
jgi:hypothetical protein